MLGAHGAPPSDLPRSPRHTVRLDTHVYYRELPQLQARLDPYATESQEIYKQLGPFHLHPSAGVVI